MMKNRKQQKKNFQLHVSVVKQKIHGITVLPEQLNSKNNKLPDLGTQIWAQIGGLLAVHHDVQNQHPL